MLIAQSWLGRSDFIDHFVTLDRGLFDDRLMATVDWAAAITALEDGTLPCSSGEQRMLRLTASLASSVPVDLQATVTGIDQHNLDLLITAIRHAAGQRPDSCPYDCEKWPIGLAGVVEDPAVARRAGDGRPAMTEVEHHDRRPEDADDGPITGHEHLATLLSDLDEFLRSRELGITALLTEFMQGRGRPNLALATSTLLDELCFTAARYR